MVLLYNSLGLLSKNFTLAEIKKILATYEFYYKGKVLLRFAHF